MTLIDAFNTAKIGDTIKHGMYGIFKTIHIKSGKGGEFNDLIGRGFADSVLLDNDWSIIKKVEKKKIIIENVKWKRASSTSGYIIFPFNLENTVDWIEFLDKPNMRMILEWEE